MGMTEYNAGLDELESESKAGDGLTRSLSVVASTNPDEEARRRDLSLRTGIPADWVPEFNDEAARRSLLDSPAVQNLPRTAPKTTAWLSDRDNASLAHDDIETLSGIEGIVDMMGRGAPDLGGAPRAFARGLKAAPSRLSTGLSETGDILLAPFLREGARLTGSKLLEDLARAPRIATDYWRREADRIAGKREAGTAANYAGQIGESIGSSVLSMPFGIGGQGAALAMFGLGSEGGYRQYTDAGYSEPYAALLSLSTKAMEGITEKMGLDVLYNPEKIARPVFRVALEFLAGELGGEEINTLWEAAKDKLTLEPGMTVADVAARVIDTAIVTIGAAGAQGVAGHYAARAADRLQTNAAASRNRDLMAALGEIAANSKLLKRLPETAREFVEHVTADGPITDIGVPVEEWTTYFQSKGLDPGQVAAEVLGDRTQFAEATATGSDLMIPLGRYVQALAGTEHHAGLWQDLRLRQGEMTAREEKAYRENLSAGLAELMEQGPGEEAPKGSDRKVYEDVLAQLVATGAAPDVATREALLWQVRYRTRAQRLGVDPYELYRERKVTITASPAPGLEETPKGVLSQAAVPPEGYPAEHEGWTYDGTYEGTGVHRYTDQNPDSPTYKDTIAVKAPEQLAGKIEGIRQRRELGQPGRPGEPLAVLSGKELGEFGNDLKALRKAAADWYKKNLQKTTAFREDIGEIRFSLKGMREFKTYGADPDKMRMIVAVKEIIEGGEYIERDSVHKPRKDTIVAFHVIEADAILGGKSYRPQVLVAEDENGNLFYDLFPDAGERDAKKALRQLPGAKSKPDTAPEGGGTTLDQSVLPADDGVNLRLLSQEGDKDRRGFIRFGPGGEVEIGLLEKADRSTFLHETGHAWLEELRQDAAREDAPQQLRDDWKRISAHLGITSLVQDAQRLNEDLLIPESAHEDFARSVEAYLMEGKAPSPELAGTFARFKAWLVQVYREISRLGVKLTPEVRGVLDRLVATDEEISAAEGAMHLAPLFTSAEDAGMTEAEFAIYRAGEEKAQAAGRERLGREVMTEYTREATALWKEDRERVRVLVEKESEKIPVFQVYHLLTRGELLDGSAPAQPVRLSRKAFVDAYGQAFVEKLPPKWFKKMTASAGMHPDLVAEMFGFKDGAEMIRQLQEAPTREAWIREETDRRMKEVHGDLLNDGSLAEAATDAVHNDDTARKLREELRAIRRKGFALREAVARGERPTGPQQAAAIQRDLRRSMEASIPPIEAFRGAARKTIRNRSVMSLRPDLHLRAEQKAGKKAFEAAAKQNWEKAGAEKKKQLLNHYLYLEARKAQEEVDGIYRYVKSLLASTGQERIGKAGGDYLAQINALLEQYEFRQVSNKAIEERQSLVEWVEEQEAQGLEPDIPPVILYNARAVNYRELKVHQLEDLRDALKNIEHLARQNGRLLGEHAEVSFNEAVVGLVNALHDNVGPGKPPRIDLETRTAIEKAGDGATVVDAALLKAEQFVEWADGKDIGGAWNTYIFQRIADAQAAEGDLTVAITAKLAEHIEAYARKIGGIKELKKQTGIEILGEKLTRQAIIAVANNVGNESNKAKMLAGRGWTEDHLKEIFSHLTRADWEFVQQTWDLIESLWPEIAALHKRMKGVELKKIEPRKFTVTLADGTTMEMRGGYYPVVYRSDLVAAGAKQLDAKSVEENFKWYVRPATEKGYTVGRTEFTGPILLSLEVVPQHFATVIHDVTHREAIIQAWRLLKNQAVKDAITETMGAPYHRMLNLWLAAVATDRDAAPTGTEGLNKWMDRLRMNATIVAMGFKFTTVVAQAMDIVQSFRRVKGKHLSRAIVRFYKNPAEARRIVHEKSGEMRHREANLDRDLRDLGRVLRGKKGVLPAAQRAAMRGIAVVDMAASIPTWMGAYEQALSEGLTETDAIRWADRAVRLSNPAGGVKDLAAIQRDRNWKLFTMFYSYFNVMYNAGRDVSRTTVRWAQGKETVSARDPRAQESFSGGELAITALALWIVPSLAGELLAGRGPDDDEEAWEWVLRTLAVYPFLSLPMVRDVANAVESGREYQMTPVAGFFATLAKEAVRLKEVGVDEREPADLILPTIDLIGYAVGLPTGQGKITGRYVWDLMEGEDPESTAEFMRNMVFYRKRK